MTTNTYPFADRELARRLERTEGGANAAFVEARARLHPSSGAEWTEIAGAYAMFDGVGSPLTQTFGLGVFAMPSDGEMARLEAFFRDRGAEVHHEVSPLADPRLLEVLAARGYRPIELSSVLFRPVGATVGAGRAPDAAIRVRRTDPAEAALWADVAAAGWGDLRFAAEQGCDLAMMGAAPGSASQRNAERQGFRIAYTRIKWALTAA